MMLMLYDVNVLLCSIMFIDVLYVIYALRFICVTYCHCHRVSAPGQIWMGDSSQAVPWENLIGAKTDQNWKKYDVLMCFNMF